MAENGQDAQDVQDWPEGLGKQLSSGANIQRSVHFPFASFHLSFFIAPATAWAMTNDKSKMEYGK